MAFVDPGSDPGAPQVPSSDAPTPPEGGAGPAGPPPGGGPIQAFIARQQMGPQVTSPGPGDMSQGTVLMTQAHGMLTQALQMFPGDSQQYKDIHRAIGVLGRHMSQNAPTAGAQQTNLQDQIRSLARNELLQHIMQGQGGQGAQGGGLGGGPPMEMGGGPMPATPFPGA